MAQASTFRAFGAAKPSFDTDSESQGYFQSFAKRGLRRQAFGLSRLNSKLPAKTAPVPISRVELFVMKLFSGELLFALALTAGGLAMIFTWLAVRYSTTAGYVTLA